MHVLHSLFEQIINVFLKGMQVTQPTGTYAYHYYIGKLLNYEPSVKQLQLTSSLFHKDMAGKIDFADPKNSSCKC